MTIFRSLQRCSVRFKPGWLKGINRLVLKPLFLYIGCVHRLLALRWCHHPVRAQESSGGVFNPGCLCILLHSSIPLSWLVGSGSNQFLLPKNIPTAWCCHHHARQHKFYWFVPQDRGLHSILLTTCLVCALTSTTEPYIDRCVGLPNHVQPTELPTGELRLRCRHISRTTSGKKMHLSSMLSSMAKAVNTFLK